MDTLEQTQEPANAAELSPTAKYMLYALLLCCAGCEAYELGLPNMIEGRGFLAKILLGMPESIWIAGYAVLEIFFLASIWKRITKVSRNIGILWLLLIGFSITTCLVGLTTDGDRESSTIGFAVGIANMIMMIVAGVATRKVALKKMTLLGNAMIWTPIAVTLATLGILALLPDDYGEIMRKTSDMGRYIRVEESYSLSTIVYSLIVVAISVIGDAIVYGCMASVISVPADEAGMKMEEEPENEAVSDPEAAPAAVAEPVVESEVREEPLFEEEEHQTRSKLKIAILGTAALVLGVGIGWLFESRSNPTPDADATPRLLERLGNLEEGESLYFLNLDDQDFNFDLSLEDGSANRVRILRSDKLGYSCGEGIGVVEDGMIRTIDQPGPPFEVSLRIFSPDHLTLERDGKIQHLYSIEYIDKEAEKVAMEKLRNRAGEELEVQIFEVDGHRMAKTNLYGLLPLDSDNTAHTIDWFPDSEEGQDATIKFEPGCVTLTYGRRNTTIVYGDNQNISDYIKLEATIAPSPYLYKITLDSQGGNSYDASNLLDGDRSTAWAVGEKKFEEFEKETEGHFPRMVGIKTVQQYPIECLTITNGYAKNNESWRNNARAKNISIMGCFEDSNSAECLYSGTLSDTDSPQTITLNKTDSYDYYNLIIEDFYPGEKWNDVCISEIEIFGK